MKRKVLLIAAIAATVILSSCGMKVEEIDPALTNLTSAYQGGAYEQAETLVKDLKKAYRKMSDEQKSKFDDSCDQQLGAGFNSSNLLFCSSDIFLYAFFKSFTSVSACSYAPP